MKPCKYCGRKPTLTQCGESVVQKEITILYHFSCQCGNETKNHESALSAFIDWQRENK